MNFSILKQELKPGLCLCRDETPWRYNALEVTLLYEMFGMGRSAVETAKLYFVCGATTEVRRLLNRLRADAYIKIYSRGTNLWRHSYRAKLLREIVAANRNLIGPKPNPQPEVWQQLLSEEPLVSSEEWLSGQGITPRSVPKTQVWVDDFDLDQLKGLSALRPVAEIFDWDADLFKRRRRLDFCRTDDFLLIEIALSELLFDQEAERQHQVEAKEAGRVYVWIDDFPLSALSSLWELPEVSEILDWVIDPPRQTPRINLCRADDLLLKRVWVTETEVHRQEERQRREESRRQAARRKVEERAQQVEANAAARRQRAAARAVARANARQLKDQQAAARRQNAQRRADARAQQSAAQAADRRQRALARAQAQQLKAAQAETRRKEREETRAAKQQQKEAVKAQRQAARAAARAAREVAKAREREEAKAAVRVKREAARARKQEETQRTEEETLRRQTVERPAATNYLATARQKVLEEAKAWDDPDFDRRPTNSATAKSAFGTPSDPKPVVTATPARNGSGESIQTPTGVIRGNIPRTCPRCRGSIVVERDFYSTYGTCLSCGYTHETRTVPLLTIEQEEEEGGEKQRRRQPSHGSLRL